MGQRAKCWPWGGIPDDNLMNGSRVFAYGFRNSFGTAFDPRIADLDALLHPSGQMLSLESSELLRAGGMMVAWMSRIGSDKTW